MDYQNPKAVIGASQSPYVGANQAAPYDLALVYGHDPSEQESTFEDYPPALPGHVQPGNNFAEYYENNPDPLALPPTADHYPAQSPNVLVLHDPSHSKRDLTSFPTAPALPPDDSDVVFMPDSSGASSPPNTVTQSPAPVPAPSSAPAPAAAPSEKRILKEIKDDDARYDMEKESGERLGYKCKYFGLFLAGVILVFLGSILGVVGYLWMMYLGIAMITTGAVLIIVPIMLMRCGWRNQRMEHKAITGMKRHRRHDDVEETQVEEITFHGGMAGGGVPHKSASTNDGV